MNAVQDFVYHFQQVTESYYAVHPGGTDPRQDPHWVQWYCQWLLHLSDWPRLLKRVPSAQEMEEVLLTLDQRFDSNSGEDWSTFIGKGLASYFSE